MSRKLITIVFLFAIVFVSAVPTPAAALQMFTTWVGAFYEWSYGTGTYALTGADSANPAISFEGDFYCFGGSVYLYTYAPTDGQVTIWYDLSGTVDSPVDLEIWTYSDTAGYDMNYGSVVGDQIDGDFHYTGSVTLDVVNGGLIFIWADFYGCGTVQGDLKLSLTGPFEQKPYQPAIKYTMWLLTRNDGTACLLKSDTHPSVEAQKAFCFPEETDRSWVADNVACFGGVDENDFWSCAAQYGQWLGLTK